MNKCNSGLTLKVFVAVFIVVSESNWGGGAPYTTAVHKEESLYI